MPIRRWIRITRLRLLPIVATLGLLLGGVAAVSVATSAPAFAVGTYNNTTIATDALTYHGQNLGVVNGQCKAFANAMVHAASVGTQSLSGYQSGYAAAGGVQVSSADAVEGDIIQITPAGSTDATAESLYNYNIPADRLHTAIIVSNKGGGNFEVVDANFVESYTVGEHAFDPYTFAPGAIIDIWQMGTIPNSTPPPSPPPPPLLIQHVYSADTSGNLWESYWGPSDSGFTTHQIGSLGIAPTATTSVDASDGTAIDYSVLPSGDLYQTYYVPGNPWATSEIDNIGTGVTALTSDLGTDGTELVYSGDSSGDIDETYYVPDDSWVTGQIATVDSAVVAMSSQLESNGSEIVYTADSAGNVYESYWVPGDTSWTTQLIGSVSGTVASISSNVSSSGTEIVYYATTNGGLYESYWVPGMTSWGTETLPSVSDGTIVAIDSSLLSDGSQRLYTATSTGDVWETYYVSGDPWVTHEIASYGATLTDLSTVLDADGDQIVYTVDSSGELREAYYVPGNPWESAVINAIGSPIVDITSGLTYQ